MQAGLHDRKLFAIDLTTEATLFGAVHSYDPPNHARYVRELNASLEFVDHASGGVRHPQLLLLGAGKWVSKDLKVIREGVTALLRAWAPAYSREFGPGRGETVLDRLAADQDVRANPQWNGKGLLPAGVLKC